MTPRGPRVRARHPRQHNRGNAHVPTTRAREPGARPPLCPRAAARRGGHLGSGRALQSQARVSSPAGSRLGLLPWPGFGGCRELGGWAGNGVRRPGKAWGEGSSHSTSTGENPLTGALGTQTETKQRLKSLAQRQTGEQEGMRMVPPGHSALGRPFSPQLHKALNTLICGHMLWGPDGCSNGSPALCTQLCSPVPITAG